MSTKERILDDVARMAGGAVGKIGDIRAQIKEEIRLRVDELALRMDMVPREEFERVENLIQQYRIEQTDMIKRIETLEKELNKKAKALK